jgi:hypothetical protein
MQGAQPVHPEGGSQPASQPALACKRQLSARLQPTSSQQAAGRHSPVHRLTTFAPCSISTCTANKTDVHLAPARPACLQPAAGSDNWLFSTCQLVGRGGCLGRETEDRALYEQETLPSRTDSYSNYSGYRRNFQLTAQKKPTVRLRSQSACVLLPAFQELRLTLLCLTSTRTCKPAATKITDICAIRRSTVAPRAK